MRRCDEEVLGRNHADADLIEIYRQSKRVQRTMYSLDYSRLGNMIMASDHGLKESRVNNSWLSKPSCVRDREGFAFDRMSTFSYNDRFCLARRNSRQSSLVDLIQSTNKSIDAARKTLNRN